MNARASQLTGARGARDQGATHVEQLAEFACHSGWEDISDPAREQLKLRADPEVFGLYVRSYGPEVNLFVDHSQIVQLECLRRGIWGTKCLCGRVVTYGGE
jgi:hypothetical protein